MSSRTVTAIAGSVWVLVFVAVRPGIPSIGSDCEALAAGVVREPVAAVSSLVLVAAGWLIAHHRTAPGLAILLAGAASMAAHASAHPTARAFDGILASVAGGVVVWSVLRERPPARRLGVGIAIALVAITIWLLTRTDAVLCDAVGPWGHAAWHVLVGAAAVVALVPPRSPIEG